MEHESPHRRARKRQEGWRDLWLDQSKRQGGFRLGARSAKAVRQGGRAEPISGSRSGRGRVYKPGAGAQGSLLPCFPVALSLRLRSRRCSLCRHEDRPALVSAVLFAAAAAGPRLRRWGDWGRGGGAGAEGGQLRPGAGAVPASPGGVLWVEAPGGGGGGRRRLGVGWRGGRPGKRLQCKREAAGLESFPNSGGFL